MLRFWLPTAGVVGLLTFAAPASGAQAMTVDTLRTACDAQSGSACDELGRRFLIGEGVAPDDVRARELFDRSCRYGEAMGCSRLGFMHETGRGVAADIVRAAALYAQGCDHGAGWGCTRLGLLYANGRGVARDDARAVALYRRGCDAGDGASCSNLGTMYQTQRSVARDDARSAALFKLACERGDGIGCAKLALMYDLGLGVTRDGPAAIDLYKRACDLGGGTNGCFMLGEIYATGRGLPKDAARAAQLFAQGCRDGEPNACEKTTASAPTQAPVAPAASAPVTNSLTFSTSQASLVWLIKPERSNDFEAAWKKLAGGLARAPEARLRQAAQGMTLFRIATGRPGYIVRIDPVVAGLSYQLTSLLTAVLSSQEATAVATTFADSTVSLSSIALEEVRLRGVTVSERALPTDSGAAAVGRTADPLNWGPITTDHAQIFFQVKDGEDRAFEQVWQEIAAAMQRSPAGRLRQAAQDLTLLRTVGKPLTVRVARRPCDRRHQVRSCGVDFRAVREVRRG